MRKQKIKFVLHRVNHNLLIPIEYTFKIHNLNYDLINKLCSMQKIKLK
jgi:hypothetical protein